MTISSELQEGVSVCAWEGVRGMESECLGEGETEGGRGPGRTPVTAPNWAVFVGPALVAPFMPR